MVPIIIHIENVKNKQFCNATQVNIISAFHNMASWLIYMWYYHIAYFLKKVNFYGNCQNTQFHTFPHQYYWHLSQHGELVSQI